MRMLNCFLLTKNLFNFFQSGLYIDFIIKKIVELFIRNVFVYTSTLFCEKFIIEFLSKKSSDNLILLFKYTCSINFFFESFFSQVILCLFYLIFVVEFLYILL